MNNEDLRKLAIKRCNQRYPPMKMIELFGFQDANNAEFVRGFRDTCVRHELQALNELNDFEPSTRH